ncbi:TIR domain-containing protein [Rubrivivax gelatinosus]|uniref:hypothetical protein n=1 Tax=Rubrivivax gelatinosus TaxID=28068 RepID=UPI00104AE7B7|nr:hypothetical protein [Rubrivivax gelatinosus]
MKIYLACGLTHVPRSDFEKYVRLIHRLALGMQDFGAEVRYPLKDSDPQLSMQSFGDRAKLCYEWDRDLVEWADLVVAECSYPSIGVGIELQIAEQSDIPGVIIFDSTSAGVAQTQYENPDGSKHWLQIGEGHVTLMALGMPNIIAAVGYRDEVDALRKILTVLESLPSR